MQVAAANADVDMLVNHLVPDASQPIENYAPDPIPEEHNQNPEEQEADSLGGPDASILPYQINSHPCHRMADHITPSRVTPIRHRMDLLFSIKFLTRQKSHQWLHT